MNNIINILYMHWSNTQSDNQEIKNMWCEIEEYLYINCSESVRESIEDYIMAFGKATEQQAFHAGFLQALQLFFEINK